MYAEDIKKQTKENLNFRKVLHTGVHAQVVAMNIKVGEDIGMETHGDVDQILYFVEGECEATLNGETRSLVEHDIVYVPAGTEHNFVNSGQTDLKLFTVYAPPQHPDGTVHATKADAQKAESHEANA
jgi:mannose-6-phosphate isomerase-like protein (cupin superfamily)